MTILRDPSGERLFLEGRLEGLGVPDLIHAICLPGRTGILTLSRGEISKSVYVQDGHLVFATSNVAGIMATFKVDTFWKLWMLETV